MTPKKYPVVFSLLLGSAIAAPTGAEVVLDGTLGPAGALAGPDYAITADLGRQAGGNLFHSFEEFNISIGESATFSGPDAVSNIIARVTGGNESSIDGMLRSTIPDADLFLLNPAGILFGPHASLDLQGSFHVSTADYLALDDGARFAGRHPEGSVLTIAPPAAFGFLDHNPAGIRFEGSGSMAAAVFLPFFGHDWNGLMVPEGETLSIIGGDIDLGAGELFAGAFGDWPVETRLLAPGGEIDVAAVGAAGEVPLADLDLTSFAALGDLTLEAGSSLDASSAAGGGRVCIRGNQFVIDNSGIWNESLGQGDGGRTDIDLRGDLVVQNHGGISGTAAGSGRGADVSISANRMLLAGDSYIGNEARAGGAAGSIAIDLRGDLEIKEGASVSGLTIGSGRGADLQIGADDLILHDGIIASLSESAGEGGVIEIELTGDLLVDHGMVLGGASGAGRGATLRLSAADAVLDHGSIFNFNSGGEGPGGIVSLTAGKLVVDHDSTIDLAMTGSGNGPALEITAETLSLVRGGGISAINTGNGEGVQAVIRVGEEIRIGNAGGIFLSNQGNGGANLLAIETSQLTIGQGGSICNNVAATGKNSGRTSILARGAVSLTGGEIVHENMGQGNGGQLTVKTQVLSLAEDGRIDAGSSGSLGGGFEGPGAATGSNDHITIETGVLSLATGGIIQAATLGPAQGGRIDITASESILIDGTLSQGEEAFAQINSFSMGSGAAGDMVIAAPLLKLTNDGAILTSSGSSGDAGNIVIQANDLQLEKGGWVSASTLSSGKGGDITIQTDRLTMAGGGLDSGVIDGLAEYELAHAVERGAPIPPGWTAESIAEILAFEKSLREQNIFFDHMDGSGPGGRISVSATEAIAISGKGGISVDTTGTGRGGDIFLSTPTLTVAGEGLISATSTRINPYATKPNGNAGRVQIEAGRISLATGGQLNTTSTGSGRAGEIAVAASESVRIEGSRKGVRSSMQSRATGSGDAGNVQIATPLLIVRDGGMVSAAALAEGDAGNVIIQGKAMGNGEGGGSLISAPVVIMDQGVLSTETYGSGQGGNIDLFVSSLAMDNSQIMARSSGSGRAGNLAVATADGVHLRSSAISTETVGADGGDITTKAVNRLHLVDSSITTSVQGGAGNGGNIAIDPRYVVLENSRIIANAYGGNGGNILLTADVFLADPASHVEASSRLGIDGTVKIDSPDTDVGGNLAVLPANYLDVTSLMRDRCAARTVEDASSLILAGRSGSPAGPAEMWSRLWLLDLAPPSGKEEGGTAPAGD